MYNPNVAPCFDWNFEKFRPRVGFLSQKIEVNWVPSTLGESFFFSDRLQAWMSHMEWDKGDDDRYIKPSLKINRILTWFVFFIRKLNLQTIIYLPQDGCLHMYINKHDEDNKNQRQFCSGLFVPCFCEPVLFAMFHLFFFDTSRNSPRSSGCTRYFSSLAQPGWPGRTGGLE